MSRNHYVSGQFNVICDVCGKKIKAGEVKHRWDGFVVCEDDWEERHPQDFVRARQDKISVPFTRPRPTDAFILQNPVWDTISLTDDDNDILDYIHPLSGYFAEDYMIDYVAFLIVCKWRRTFIDTVSDLQEQFGMSYNMGSILDSISFTETVDIVRRFLRTFNDTATLIDTTVFNTFKNLFDTVLVVDNNNNNVDYIYPLSDYFLEDYMIDYTAIFIIMSWKRAFVDMIDIVNEQISLQFNSNFAETTSISDTITTLLTIKRSLSDTISSTDSGYAFVNNYIDPTYFVSQYVGSVTTF